MSLIACIKVFKNSSAIIIKTLKKGYKEKPVKNIKAFLKKKKKKSDNMVVSNTKIYLKKLL